VYSQNTAYLLWFLSGFGALGLHRFYVGKIGSGLLYFFTGGFFMIGALMDFFYIPTLVREANLSQRYREVLQDRMQGEPPLARAVNAKESVERVILKTAKKNRGMVTSSQVALEGDVTIDEAQEYLEKLAAKGFAEMRIRESGGIVFCFPEFLDQTRSDSDVSEL
jgi:TM2 domain-containing membrane protein YozV